MRVLDFLETRINKEIVLYLAPNLSNTTIYNCIKPHICEWELSTLSATNDQLKHNWKVPIHVEREHQL